MFPVPYKIHNGNHLHHHSSTVLKYTTATQYDSENTPLYDCIVALCAQSGKLFHVPTLNDRNILQNVLVVTELLCEMVHLLINSFYIRTDSY